MQDDLAQACAGGLWLLAWVRSPSVCDQLLLSQPVICFPNRSASTALSRGQAQPWSLPTHDERRQNWTRRPMQAQEHYEVRRGSHAPACANRCPQPRARRWRNPAHDHEPSNISGHEPSNVCLEGKPSNVVISTHVMLSYKLRDASSFLNQFNGIHTGEEILVKIS